MRVLFDTNVLASAFTSLGLCHQIYERTLLIAKMVSSKKLLDELRRTLVKKMKVDAALAEEIIVELTNEFELVEPKLLPQPVCRDADDDDVVLATALAAKSEVIITGDDDLLVLKEFQGIKIISPRQFVELLDAK